SSVGGGRSAPRASLDGQRALRHRAHRNHSPDRDREEERDPDDRLRDRGGASGEQEPRGLDLSGLPAAIPADPDDDDGGDARRIAAGDRRRNGSRAAASARHRDRGRTPFLTDADSVHDTGGLSLPRSPPAPMARLPPPPSPQARTGGIARMTAVR